VIQIKHNDLWNNAHTATLEDYGLKEGFGVLFHPSVEDMI